MNISSVAYPAVFTHVTSSTHVSPLLANISPSDYRSSIGDSFNLSTFIVNSIQPSSTLSSIPSIFHRVHNDYEKGRSHLSNGSSKTSSLSLFNAHDRLMRSRNRYPPVMPTWAGYPHYGYPADVAAVYPTQLDRFDVPHSYGRAHLMTGAHADTSVSWHSLLQLMLLALLATGGTIGNIFIISGLTIIEHFQMPGSIYLVSVALANLLITVIAVPCSCIEIMAVAPNHPDVCALQWFLTQLAAVVTLISFALISVENFFSLFCPPSTCSRLLCSKMRILLLLLLLWTAAIMLPWLRQLYRLTPDLCAPFVHSSLSSSVVASAASAAATSTSVLPSSSSSSSSLSSSGTSSSATAASSSSALSSSSSSDLLSSASSSTASSSAPSSPSVVNSSFAVPSFSVPFAALSPNGAPTTFAAHSSVKFSFSSLLVDDHHHVGSDNAKAQLGILWPRLHLTVFVCVLCIPHLISLVFFANCAVRIKRIRQRLRAAISGTESYANYPTVAGDFALIQSNMAVNAYASISWCPLIVCVFLSAFTEFADPNLIAIAWWLAWTFSCMYSFAYALLNRDFGEAFFKLFFYCCCKSHVTFVRKSFAYRRPSISNTLAAASRRRADPSSSGESFGLRVHIIPGLNMSQRRDTFGQSGGSTGGAIGGGGGGIGGMSGSSTGYGHHSSGILRSESFGRSGPFKAYGQMGASGNSHHHHHHHHSHHPHIWSNAHKSTSGRTVYEKESESAFATSRTEHDLSNRDQRHAIGFGRTFAGAGHTTSNKFCASSKYVSDL